VTGPRRVVVGVDGSEDSVRALTWTVELVEGSGAEIVAVHALGLLAHTDGAAEVPSPHYRVDVAARLEQEWCRPLAQSSVAYRCVVTDGDPVTAVLRAAREHGADLVVVGRRGSGGHPGLVLGSTSQQLVVDADLPVTVVPSGAPRS
jgi:nucleotide-binding universal stress UspA family protein